MRHFRNIFLSLSTATFTLASLFSVQSEANPFASGSFFTTAPVTQAGASMAVPKGVVKPLTFKSAKPFSLLTFDDRNRTQAEFGPDAFYGDVVAKCLVQGSFGSRYETKPLNPLHYATREVADYIASAMGGVVVEVEIIPYPCVINRPQLAIRFENPSSHQFEDLNAGLVANTFNQNLEWRALLGLRSEFATQFGKQVPTWDQAAHALRCGQSVLEIVLKNAAEGCH